MTETIDQSDKLDDRDSKVGPGGWPVPADDERRVAALRSYGVLDKQQSQPDLDAALRLAAYVSGLPVASINLIDAERMWQAASFGRAPVELPRQSAICSWVVTGKDVVHVADASLDDRFATLSAVTDPSDPVRSYASAPLRTRDGFSIGTVCVYSPQAGQLSDLQLGLLRDVADQVMRLFELRRTAAALARAASSDALTGLANRRSVEQAIGSAIARADRGLGMPSVVVVDLDSFKQVNDLYGHAAGDAVLRAVGDRLRRTARVVDTVARLGGDEFVVLLEHTGGPGASAALARLRGSLEAIDELGEGVATNELRASLGIATYRPGDSVASLLARADAEMFADKSQRS
jgi:diguanylate cyclase (GGDEF)-like protein